MQYNLYTFPTPRKSFNNIVRKKRSHEAKMAMLMGHLVHQAFRMLSCK